jgi:hypothetical protein
MCVAHRFAQVNHSAVDAGESRPGLRAGRGDARVGLPGVWGANANDEALSLRGTPVVVLSIFLRTPDPHNRVSQNRPHEQDPHTACGTTQPHMAPTLRAHRSS